MRLAIAIAVSGAFHILLFGAMRYWTGAAESDQNVRVRVASGRPLQLVATVMQRRVESTITIAPLKVEPKPNETTRLHRAALEVSKRDPDAPGRPEFSPIETPAETPHVASEAAPRASEREPLPEVPETEIHAERRETESPPPQPASIALRQNETAGAEVDVNPKKLPSNPPPAYPADALRRRVEGRVMLRVSVAPSGAVDAATIEATSGSLSLDRAALEAVLAWKFEPARRAGVNVSAVVLVPIRFSIQRG
jgi:protein TonB